MRSFKAYAFNFLPSWAWLTEEVVTREREKEPEHCLMRIIPVIRYTWQVERGRACRLAFV